MASRHLLVFAITLTLAGCSAGTDDEQAATDEAAFSAPTIATLALGARQQIDYFSVRRDVAIELQAVAGTRSIIDLHHQQQGSARLLDPSGTLVGELVRKPGKSNRRLVFTPATTGTYRLLFAGPYEQWLNVEFGKEIRFQEPADPFDPNSCSGPSLNPDEHVYTQMFSADGTPRERGQYKIYARSRQWLVTYREETKPTPNPAVLELHRDFVRAATPTAWQESDPGLAVTVRGRPWGNWPVSAPVAAEGTMTAHLTMFTDMPTALWAEFGAPTGARVGFGEQAFGFYGAGVMASGTVAIAGKGGSFPHGFTSMPRRAKNRLTAHCARGVLRSFDEEPAAVSEQGNEKTYRATETEAVVFGIFDLPLR